MALGNEGLEMWPLTQAEECAVTGFLRDKLQYRNRLQYMASVSALAEAPAQAPGLPGCRTFGPLPWVHVSPEPPMAPLSPFLHRTRQGTWSTRSPLWPAIPGPSTPAA